MVVAAEWGTGEVFLTMLYFWLFLLWIWLVVAIFTDIFRSDDLTGWTKAAWSIFVIVLPYLGVFVYIIARGKSMGDRSMRSAQRSAAAYYPPPAAPSSESSAASRSVEQLTKLAQMREDGVIDDAQFQQLKAKVLAA